MKNWKRTTISIFAVLFAVGLSPDIADAGHWNSGWNYPAGNYYAPRVHYQPVIVSPVVYHRPVVSYPIYAQPQVPSYTRTTKYDPYGRFARITRKTYTPYGTAETKYRFDVRHLASQI